MAKLKERPTYIDRCTRPDCKQEGWHAHAEDVEHEITTPADLARGVRVFLLPNGTTLEEPAGEGTLTYELTADE